MAVQMQPTFILPEKFEKLKFSDYVVPDSMSTPSTPSTPCSPPAEPYTIEILSENDREEVLNFLRTFFFKDEPLNFFLDLINEENPTCQELEDFSVKDLSNGLNIKAVSAGKTIGICLNSILERGFLDKEEPINCPNPKFRKILRLLDHVARESDVFKQFPNDDKAMTVKIISVDGAYRGKGIAKDLLAKTRDLAKEQGCGYMTVDCTSHFSAMALKKLGFKCIYSLNYADYKPDGEVVFKPAPPHLAVTVYAQKVQ